MRDSVAVVYGVFTHASLTGGMVGYFKIWADRLLHPVPEEIRADYVMNCFGRLQVQVPVLYALMIMLVVAAMLGAGDGAPLAVRFGIPVAVIGASLVRMATWMKRRGARPDPVQAARLMRSMVVVSGLIASLCSAWCVLSWLNASTASRAYLPLFMAMGSLSTAYCLSASRVGVLTNLGIGVPPIAIALLATGNRLDIAAACALLVASGFLVRMVLQQHRQIVDLLLLQRRMRILAETDSLTGLTNRRALYARLEKEIAAASPGQGPTIVLIDLDGFKPVNDRYGHGAGDEVLRQVADRFRLACGDGCLVARLGGDEFAILVPAGTMVGGPGAAQQALATLARPILVAGQSVRISACAGVARFPMDADTADELFIVADRALYEAKAEAHQPLPAWEEHQLTNWAS